MSSREKKVNTKVSKKLGNELVAPSLNLLYVLKWVWICVIMSLLIGTTSAGFLHSLNWIIDFREHNQWLIFGLPLGGLFTGLLYYYFGKDVEAGNHLLIETAHNPKQTIPFRLAPFVFIGTLITHLFGGSSGREGTALQMAGTIADQLNKPFKLTKEDRKTAIIAAVAGGFGSVFGTPLAGAIFALEVFTKSNIRLPVLLSVFVTAWLANLVSDFWQAPHTYYHVNFIPNLTFINIIYTIIAGVLFGLCANLFSKLLHKFSNLFKRKIAYPPLRPFAGGVLITCIVWAIGTTKYSGLGIPSIVLAFDEQAPIYVFALKFILTVVTISAGFKGGEATPLFFIGATLGSTLSLALPLPTGLLAGMGFVAVFAGATKTPLSGICIAIELFGTECGVYVAIGCIVSYLVSGSQSIFTSPSKMIS